MNAMTIHDEVAIARRAKPTSPVPFQLLYAYEVDRLFRLRHGTAHRDAALHLIPSTTRQRGSRTCYLISLADATEHWGPK